MANAYARALVDTIRTAPVMMHTASKEWGTAYAIWQHPRANIMCSIHDGVLFPRKVEVETYDTLRPAIYHPQSWAECVAILQRELRAMCIDP